jgi:hypothetical protein
MKKIIFFLTISCHLYAQETNINNVLDIKPTIKGYPDYTHDNIINCQDRAIWFYYTYSDLYGSENVRIIYNSSPKTSEKDGLYHVFNSVFINSQWINIDSIGYPADYLVEDIMSSFNYDPTKNIDVTSCWDGTKWIDPPWETNPVKITYRKNFKKYKHLISERSHHY